MLTYRSFQANAKGRAIAALLSDATTIRRLEGAARAGQPPVGALDSAIAQTIGSLDRTERQHVGRMVRDVLQPRGWRVDSKPRGRIDGKVFRTGALFRPSAAQPMPPTTVTDEPRSDMIERMERARAILERSRYPNAPRDTVDAFLADRRAMWGE